MYTFAVTSHPILSFIYSCRLQTDASVMLVNLLVRLHTMLPPLCHQKIFGDTPRDVPRRLSSILAFKSQPMTVLEALTVTSVCTRDYNDSCQTSTNQCRLSTNRADPSTTCWPQPRWYSVLWQPLLFASYRCGWH